MAFLNALLILSSILNVFSLPVSDQQYLQVCADHWTTLTPEQQFDWQRYADEHYPGYTGFAAFCIVNLRDKPKILDDEPPSE